MQTAFALILLRNANDPRLYSKFWMQFFFTYI